MARSLRHGAAHGGTRARPLGSAGAQTSRTVHAWYASELVRASRTANTKRTSHEPSQRARGTREQPRSLLNGALGFVTSVDQTSLSVDFDDGAEHLLRRSDLAKLERGWAISIHKAQGSAFRHVIVPIVASALLDRALFKIDW